MPDSVDAVVIGAGHNGLVAANLLADAGWQVTLCEATPFIGGAVRSAEITAPGFSSDLFSAFYPLSAASPVIAALDLPYWGLRWTHAPDVLAHVFPDDRCALLSRDLDRTAGSLEEFAAGDGDAWRSVVAYWRSIEQPLINALLRPLPAVRPASKLFGSLGIAGSLRLARTALQPVRRLGEEWFHGDGATILLAGNALHADLPPEGAGSGVYGWLLSMLGQVHGFPVPVGGAGKLTEAMAARFVAQGGSIKLASAVDSIEVRGGRAVGVHLVTGEYLAASRAVVADVPAPNLYHDLVGHQHLPPRMIQDLQNFQWDAPTMKLNWALREPIPWTAADARGAGTIHLGVDLDGLTRYAADLATQTMPVEPFVLLGQMTTSDASRSPAGTESAWAYTHLPAGLIDREDLIAEQAAKVERLIERHAPGFMDRIIGRAVQSPHALHEDDPSLVQGAIIGGTAQVHQQLIFRPVPGLGGASTPIDQLFLGSSSAHPGGGVHGAPGSNAALAALARHRALGPLRRKATDAALQRIYRR